MQTNSAKCPKHAFKSYERSILEYGTIVLTISPMRARLEAVQSSFTRKLWTRLHGYDYIRISPATVRNKVYNMPTVAHRRRKYYLVMVYE